MIERHAHSQAELRVVFKKRVAPCRTTSLTIRRVRSGRQIAAVDAGTAGGICDYGSVAKQLCQQLDVWCFAAAGARARELEQRLQQLHILNRAEAQVTGLVN